MSPCHLKVALPPEREKNMVIFLFLPCFHFVSSQNNENKLSNGKLVEFFISAVIFYLKDHLLPQKNKNQQNNTTTKNCFRGVVFPRYLQKYVTYIRQILHQALANKNKARVLEDKQLEV